MMKTRRIRWTGYITRMEDNVIIVHEASVKIITIQRALVNTMRRPTSGSVNYSLIICLVNFI